MIGVGESTPLPIWAARTLALMRPVAQAGSMASAVAADLAVMLPEVTLTAQMVVLQLPSSRIMLP